MPWSAKPGCPQHHRAVIERMVNALPASYLLPPCSGELFDSLDACNRRLRGYALAEGFDIVRKGGGTKANPSYRFRCIHHGVETRNDRKLEDHVERDSEGKRISKRKVEGRPVHQLECPWSALCSFKAIAQGSGVKGFILTMQGEAHVGHPLVDDPFVYTAHLKASEEYQEALRQAKKHREQVLPYSTSRRLINAEDLSVVLSSQDYYNAVRKDVPDKIKPETIDALLRMLKDQQFVYQTRSEEVIDEITGEVTARKLVQLFFAHREQLVAT
jgi:hypothetical protein